MVRILVALAACVAIACVLAQQPTPQQQPAAVQLQRGIYAQLRCCVLRSLESEALQFLRLRTSSTRLNLLPARLKLVRKQVPRFSRL